MFSSLLKSTPVRRSLTFALSKRTLQTTATIKTNHWRPRWQHENRGQYWGAEWLRRNMVVELENFWHVILFVLWCSYMYRKFFHRQDKEMELSWRKFQGKGQLNEQFEEMDDHAYYPRPIRQSELDDPKNVWHRFKYRIGQFWRNLLLTGDFNTQGCPKHDALSGWASNDVMIPALHLPRSLPGPFGRDSQLIRDARNYDWKDSEKM